MEQEIVQAVNGIGLKLLTHFQKEGSPSNTLISPLCITLAIIMLTSTIEQKQQEKLYNSMGLSDPESVNNTFIRIQNVLQTSATHSLASASALFVQDWLMDSNINTEFLKAIGATFAAYANLIEAKDEMNELIFQASRGMFKDFLSSNQLQDAVAVFINVLSFKGIWEENFATAYTRKDYIFHQSLTKTTRVEMMFKRDFRTEVAEHQDCTVVRLPFRTPMNGPAMFFEAYLPHFSGDFDQIIRDIQPARLQFRYVTLAEFGLPRFQIHTVRDITKSLERLGFPINNNREQALENAILHGAAIEVDEEGSRAAAVTAVVQLFGSTSRQEFKRIVMDKPFLFTITEKLGLNLFIGIFAG